MLGIVERVFPDRPWARLWALAGFCACPAVFKPAAMLHPQPLVLFFTALALYVLVRLVGQVRWSITIPSPSVPLLTHGTDSPTWLRLVTDELARSIVPHVERLTLVGAGHVPHSTNPAPYGPRRAPSSP